MESDMYFVAMLISYGVGYSGTKVETIGNKKQVFFSFPEGVVIKTFVLDGGKITSVESDINTCYSMFLLSKIMFPPDYPNSIRNVKSAIYAKLRE